MKRFLTFVFVLLFIFVAPTITAQTIWDGTTDTEWFGSGTQADPYQISTAAELAGFAELVTDSNTFEGKYLKITADIHLNDAATPDSLKREWPMIGFYDAEANYTKTAFSGHLDGGNHTIYGVYRGKMPVDTTNVDDWDQDLEIDFTGWYNGFFGYLLNATVENLRFDNMTMLGGAAVGGLCHCNDGGTIRNVHITNSWIGSSTGENGGAGGGLVASNDGGLIENCTVDATVQGLMNVGVLVGDNSQNSIIRDCSTSGHAFTKRGAVGGFVGRNYGGLIERCSSSATVSHLYHKYASTQDITCAGFAGVNCGVIRDSYATGDVIDAQLSGAGFCGSNYSFVHVYSSKDYTALGRIENCYSTGDVYVTGMGNIAAFMGDNGNKGTYNGTTDHQPGTVINCFATGKAQFTTDEGMYQYHGGFTTGMTPKDIAIIIANGYFDKDKNPQCDIKRGGAFGVTAEYMQSKEFVDTLNMMSALLGLTKWQYNPGGYPTLTTEKATNLTDYLGGGSGTKDDPWLISTKAHLYNLAKYTNHGYNFAGKYILQTADIAMNAPQELWGEEAPELWEPIGHTFSYPVWNGGDDPATWYNTGSYTYVFCGHYDGGLHEVQNLYAKDNKYGVGFFGSLVNAQIRNLGVTGAYMRGDEEMGILGVRMHTEVTTNVWGDVPPMQIRQCWTSGSVDLVNLVGGVTSLVGDWTQQGYIGYDSGTDNAIVNCYSSATLGGAQLYTKLFTDSYNVDDIKERANMLYYGKVTADNHIGPFRNQYANENYFINYDSITGDHYDTPLNDFYSTTAQMQSKELLNRMNYFVSKYNHLHPTDPILFWKHNAGAYPSFTATEPEHTVTFVSNGGTEFIPERVYDNSKMYLPPHPTKEGATFAGWYADSELTQVFDTAGVVLSDTTLYAKWLTEVVPDYKPFTNEFATAYVIKTKEQLYAFANIVNGKANISSFIEPTSLEGKTVKLGADIMLNDTTDWKYWGKGACAVNWEPIGYYTNKIKFEGTFDGQGYTISGLYCASESGGSCGLFGQVGEKAIIRNVNIKAAYVYGAQGGSALGLLISSNKGTVANCNVEGNIHARSGNDLGLLIGSNDGARGNITNCHAKGSISGNVTSNVGGLIGSMQLQSEYINDTIRNCSAEVTMHFTFYLGSYGCIGGLIGHISDNVYVIGCHSNSDIDNVVGSSVGGLIGKFDNFEDDGGYIDSCYATGNIRAKGYYVGGLVGECDKVIRNSYATGSVTGNGQVGGLAGYAASNLSKCYATGDVTASSYTAGGLVGETYVSTSITDCYATSNVTASGEKVGGLIGDLGVGAYTNCALTRCWSMGDVSGTNSVGGLIGEADGIIVANQCYSEGDVTGTGEEVSGLIGVASKPRLTDCYAIGNVQGSDRVAGLAASGYNSILTNSYFVGKLTATNAEAQYVGPVYAYSADYGAINTTFFDNTLHTSDLSYGRSTEQMKQASTFATWDFEEIWGIHPNVNNGYPFLRYSLKDQKVDILMLSQNNVVLKLGETKQLTAFAPETVQEPLVWESGNAEIATCVDGLITPIAYGKTYVVAHTADNILSDTCWVQVVCDPTGIVISEQEVTILRNSTYQLTAQVLPMEAEQRVMWTDNDGYVPARFEVDLNGLVRSTESTGTWKVFATTEDGKYRDTCIVKVVSKLPLQSITLSHQEITLEVGQSATISASVYPEGSAELTGYDWSWSSGDDYRVANLSGDANDGYNITVTGIGAGTAHLVVSKNGISDTCKITVTDPSKVTGVELEQHELTLEVGQRYTLSATVLPETAENKNVRWYADDSGVVSVGRSTGEITAKKVGTAAVWAETRDGGFKDTCYVTVIEAQPAVVPVTGITLSETVLALKVGDTHTLTVTISPSNATNKNYSWASSASAIVSVDNVGKLTALATGSATITVTTEDGGKTAICQVTVSEPEPEVIHVTGITLSETSLELEMGDTHTLIATITPENATNQNINWLSTNTSIVSVQDGLLTAIAEGSATIIATTEDGGKTAMCNVTVEEGTTSAIEFVQDNSSNSVRKVFENGTIYILRSGERYMLDGRKAK